mmetsp:Transcript_16124/g.40654  ORF Transcript_16124/g.40654 Transcript_16124/m.40654 type:complete len:270 (-) Transcript_16124:232-1041(-)
MKSATGPSRSARNILVPSGLQTRPLRVMMPSLVLACAAMGVLQEPSRVARKDLSHETSVLVSPWLSALMYFIVFSSSDRTWMPMAPWATAGSISSQSRVLVMQSVMDMRLRPARARRVASTTSSSSLRRRVWTLPRKLTHLIPGLTARIWAWRRRDAEPMTAPSGRASIESYLGEMKASRVSSRGSMVSRCVPSGRKVGTSFIECTQKSTSLVSSATSSSFVKRPLPPISLRALSSFISPEVLMMLICTCSPSLPSSSGNASASLFLVS